MGRKEARRRKEEKGIEGRIGRSKGGREGGREEKPVL